MVMVGSPYVRVSNKARAGKIHVAIYQSIHPSYGDPIRFSELAVEGREEGLDLRVSFVSRSHCIAF